MRIGQIIGIAVALAWALASRGSATAVATTAVAWAASASNQIGLVVDFGSGVVITRCIQFAETQLTGYDVLNQSGLALVVGQSSGMGASVCAINDTGCSASPCFCAMPTYWSYWHLTNGAWVYAMGGASNSVVLPGAVDGWRWGGTTPPQVVPFNQVCGTPPSPTAVVIVPTASPASPLPPTITPTPGNSSRRANGNARSRVIFVPATSTPAPPTATQAAAQTPVLPSATSSPSQSTQAVAATPVPSLTTAPSPTAIASDAEVAAMTASPTIAAKPTETVVRLETVAATEPPTAVPSSTVASLPEAAESGSPSPTAVTEAVRATSNPTVSSVPIALLGQDSVSQAAIAATRVPPRAPLPPTATLPPVVASEALPSRPNLPIGYVVFGVAILALLIYLYGGQRDP